MIQAENPEKRKRKIILSRKGFDTENGGQPSPIMPDGTMLSLPIHYNDNDTYANLFYKHEGHPYSYFEIIEQLKDNPKVNRNCTCHLDPDIREEAKKRKKDWKPAYGQSGGDLMKLKDVNEGDIFLFFGWFRFAEFKGGKFKYEKKSNSFHAIYGYLEIKKKYLLSCEKNYIEVDEWLKEHPHANYKKYGMDKNNMIYISDNDNSRCFRFNKNIIENNGLRLTKYGHKNISTWELPACFDPDKVLLTHNENRSNWDPETEYPYTKGNRILKSAGRGQEFIILERDNKDNGSPQAVIDWAKKLIDDHPLCG